MAKDLWPEIRTVDIATPAGILREQAVLLGPKTSNVVIAELATVPNPEGGVFTYVLRLVAPALDNYVFALLRVAHQVEMYPARLIDFANGVRYDAENEAEYRDVLAAVLSSEKVKAIIESMIVQSAAMMPEDA